MVPEFYETPRFYPEVLLEESKDPREDEAGEFVVRVPEEGHAQNVASSQRSRGEPESDLWLVQLWKQACGQHHLHYLESKRRHEAYWSHAKVGCFRAFPY